jgi:hypothetical protein
MVYIPKFCIIFCNNGGNKNANGRDTKNPIPAPINQAIKNELLNPILMAAMTKDMLIDMTKAIQKPLNRI